MQVRVIPEKDSKKKRGLLGKGENDSSKNKASSADGGKLFGKKRKTAIAGDHSAEQVNTHAPETGDTIGDQADDGQPVVISASGADDGEVVSPSETSTDAGKTSSHVSDKSPSEEVKDAAGENGAVSNESDGSIAHESDDSSDKRRSSRLFKSKRKGRDSTAAHNGGDSDDNSGVIEAELVDEFDISDVQPSPVIFVIMLCALLLLCGVAGFTAGGEIVRLLGVLA